MAKSKADYQAEGAAIAARVIAGELSGYRFDNDRSSWQQAAFRDGYENAMRDAAEKKAAMQIMCDGEAARTARDDGGCLTFASVAAQVIERKQSAPQRVEPARNPRSVKSGSQAFDARYSHIACLRADADKETNPARAARLRAKVNVIMSRLCDESRA